MLSASILAASLMVTSAGAPALASETIISQAEKYALKFTVIPASRPHVIHSARKQTADPSWDGALKGAAIGGFAGLIVGFVAEGNNGGSASYGFSVVPTAALTGAAIGAVTGLIIDRVKR